MAKYHINNKGVPSICKANHKCRFATEDNHFSSKEAAQLFNDFKEEFENNNSISLTKYTINSLDSMTLNIFINYTKSQLNTMKDNHKTAQDFVRAKSEKLESDYYENLSDDDKLIITKTKEYYNKGYLYQGEYVEYPNSTVPKAYLENIDPKLAKVISQHSLVHKFGPRKGRPILDPKQFTEKNLNWMAQYKNNQEQLEKDLNIIKSNMVNFNNLFSKGKLKTSYIRNNINDSINQKVESVIYTNPSIDKLETTLKILEQEKIVKDYLNRYEKSAVIKETINSKNITKNVGHVDDNINHFELKNLKSDPKGNIINLYIKDENNNIYQVNKLNDSITNNIEATLKDENGNIIENKVFNIKTLYGRRRLGRYATAEENTTNLEFIVTENNKRGSKDYDGFKGIHHTYLDSTE